MKKILFYLLLVTFSVSLIACSNNNDDERSETERDYPISNNIADIIKASDVIVAGSFTKYASSWNMYRDIVDISKEASNQYAEGRLYEFEISEYLQGGKGKSSTILVNLEYSDNEVVNEFYVEPKLKENTVLFLKYNKDFDHYFPAIEPFQFNVLGEKLEVVSNLKDSKASFKELKFEDLKEKIKR